MRASIFLFVLTLGSVAVALMWFRFDSDMVQFRPPEMKRQPFRDSQLCRKCRKMLENTVTTYSQTWTRQEQHQKEFRNLLARECNGSNGAIVTRANSPLHTLLAPKRVVNKYFYNLLPPVNPFFNKTWDTCSVVGNGGILIDSHCGAEIDSADFVIRCNLPPVHGVFKTHVGNKSSFVTANPSIFRKLIKQKNYSKIVVERIKAFGDAMIAYPDQNRQIYHNFHILQKINSPSRQVFLHPMYMEKLKSFWRSKGVRAARISSGLFMVSLALELCTNVQVYGFWPFNMDPFGRYYLPHHYYDNTMPLHFHKMPAEFLNLLQLHVQGVIRLQLGSCRKSSSRH